MTPEQEKELLQSVPRSDFLIPNASFNVPRTVGKKSCFVKSVAMGYGDFDVGQKHTLKATKHFLNGPLRSEYFDLAFFVLKIIKKYPLRLFRICEAHESQRTHRFPEENDGQG